EIPSEKEIKTSDELRVELPEKSADFHTLGLDIAASLPRHAGLPAGAESVSPWQTERRQELADTLRKFRKYDVQSEVVVEEAKGRVGATCWKLNLESDWTVPVVELSRGGGPKETVILVADEGRSSATDAVTALLESGKRVLAV